MQSLCFIVQSPFYKYKAERIHGQSNMSKVRQYELTLSRYSAYVINDRGAFTLSLLTYVRESSWPML
jgi:hypothetical protein